MAHISASLFKTPLPFAKVVSNEAAKLQDCRLPLSPQRGALSMVLTWAVPGSKVRSGRAAFLTAPLTQCWVQLSFADGRQGCR